MMFGDNEKMRNLLIYGVPLSDKELSEVAPYFVISIMVIIAVLFIVGICLI